MKTLREVLKRDREEAPDAHERDINHLKNAEQAYTELASKYNFKTIECTHGNDIRTIDDIGEDIYNYVKKQLEK